MATLVLCVASAAGVFLWRMSASHADVYERLNISPLPLTLELQPQFYSRLGELSREPCYRDAAVGLSDALLASGYPRESATALLAFVKRCASANDEDILVRAYRGFEKAGDFSAAIQIADQLANSDPANPHFRYSRGATYEQLRDFSNALTDYMAALELLGDPSNVVGSQFYDISRMYAALGRYCDAIAPIETFISFDPVSRRNPQTTKIIAEYAEKGSCDMRYARGVGYVPLINANGIHTLPVVVNGVPGNFILDSGANLVTVTTNFSAKAKVHVAASNALPIKTVGGRLIADLGYADKISVGNAEAQSVAVAIIRNADDPFGGHLDGLLGMSFLSRFNMRMSQSGIELAPVPLR